MERTSGGYTDWRLPTIKELYSLINFDGITGTSASDSKPYINTEYFDFQYGDTTAGYRFIDAQYWSSTEYVSTTMNGNATVFGVNFADGRIKGYPKLKGNSSNKMFVKYVRGNTDYGKNAFVDNKDGTVSDNATGLMWMTVDSGSLKAGTAQDGKLNWEQALSFSENLTYAGYSDWRLPNAKELQSIVDYTRSPDTTKSAAIDPVFQTTAIKDPAGNTNYPYFWTSTTHLDGINLGSAAVYVAFGEAQGFMQGPANSGDYKLMDVHGAGAQRSDPKKGDASQYPHGRGPQGDVISINNYVRCVRNINSQTVNPNTSNNTNTSNSTNINNKVSDLSVTLIGTGGPKSSSERASSSTLIKYKDKYFLVDMGNGTQDRLDQLGINTGKIDTLMFTHHHQDHDAEYFGVAADGWLKGRKNLNLIGTSGTAAMHKFYTDFYKEDLEYRTSKKDSWSWDGMITNVNIKEVAGNESFEINGVKITTTNVNHTIATQAYRFDADGKSIVVSGDLTYSENLIKLAENADILVMDSGVIITKGASSEGKNNSSNNKATTKPVAKQNTTDTKKAHGSLSEIATMAQKAGVKKLVLTHIVGDIDVEAEKLALSEIYKGEIIIGSDLMEVSIPVK